MKTVPMIFNQAMMAVLLSGQKVVTRRPMKHDAQHNPIMSPVPCSVGDLLWVRETWQVRQSLAGIAPRPSLIANVVFGGNPLTGHAVYRADGEIALTDSVLKQPWMPSIHMPRPISRLSLRVTDVRAEHLHQITPQQAIDEGITSDDPVAAFGALWDSIYKDWDANPLVWVIEFKTIHANVDAITTDIAKHA